MQFDFSEEWCKKAAELEGNDNVSAGVPMSVDTTLYTVLTRDAFVEEFKKIARQEQRLLWAGRAFSSDIGQGTITANFETFKKIINGFSTRKLDEDEITARAQIAEYNLMGMRPIIIDNTTGVELRSSLPEVDPIRFYFTEYVNEHPPYDYR